MSQRGGFGLAPLLAVFACGCALGPNYHRPTVPMSTTFRDQRVAEARSFADLPWWQVYHDPHLSALIREALEHSYNLADAVARVEQARALARVQTDALFPSLGVQIGASRNRTSPFLIPGVTKTNPTYNDYQIQGTSSWEIDLWGHLRRLREAALANALAAEENRRGVIVSLVGDLAEDYFQLLALDLERAVAQATVTSRRQTLALYIEQDRGGVGDRLQTSTEEAAVADAAATLPSLKLQIIQKENQMSILLGRPPGPIARGQDLAHWPIPPTVPAGLPSALLERRPDLRQAEAQVMAANAQVGAALAAMFPKLSLFGSGGLESDSLSSLFSGGAAVYGFGLIANFIAPILNGAQNYHQFQAQKANLRAAVAQYRQAVLSALADVANALASIDQLRAQRAQLEQEARARRESLELAKVRFRAGVATYLDITQAEQNLFAAELTLAQTVGGQFVAMSQLYRALGGGWQLPPAAPKAR